MIAVFRERGNCCKQAITQNPSMSDIANFADYFKSGIEPVILSTALSSAGPIASAVTVPAANSVRPASEIIAWTIPVASHCPFRISSSANECAARAILV